MPENVVICDTAPMVYLYAMDSLWILEKVYKQIIVSPEVVGELDAAQLEERDVPVIYEFPWIQMRTPRFELYVQFKDLLGPIEGSTLALAADEANQPALVIMDDRRGRAVAKERNIRATGTVGVLMKAKISGFIDTVKDKLDLLIAAGYHIDHYFYADILSLAGETEV